MLDSFVPWKTEQETFLQKLNSYVAVLEHLFVGPTATSVSMNLSRNLLEMLILGMLQSLHGYPSDAAAKFSRALVSADIAWRLFLEWKPRSMVSCPVVYLSSLQSENGAEDWKPFCTEELTVVFTEESHIQLQHAASRFFL